MTFLRVFECFILFYFFCRSFEICLFKLFYIRIYCCFSFRGHIHEIPFEGLPFGQMSRTFISVYQFRGPFSVRWQCLCYIPIEMLLPHTHHICICTYILFFFLSTWHDCWPLDCLYLCFPPFSIVNLSRKETAKHVRSHTDCVLINIFSDDFRLPRVILRCFHLGSLFCFLFQPVKLKSWPPNEQQQQQSRRILKIREFHKIKRRTCFQSPAMNSANELPNGEEKKSIYLSYKKENMINIRHI